MTLAIKVALNPNTTNQSLDGFVVSEKSCTIMEDGPLTWRKYERERALVAYK